MKIGQFKNLIKEAVRDVIKDELRDILREELISFGKVLSEGVVKEQPKKFDYKDFLFPDKNGINENKYKKPIRETGNPVMDLLLETQQNMNPSEASNYTNVGNFTTNEIAMPMHMNPMMGDPDVNPAIMADDGFESVRMPEMPSFGNLMK